MDKDFPLFGVSGTKAPARPIPKVRTGIQGLDDILEGGLPENQITVISGGTGTGKTILGLEFAYQSALNEDPVIFVSFEERADVIRRNASALGWDLSPLEKSGVFFLIDSRPSADMVHAGEFNLVGLMAIISGQAKAMGARRLVIDSIDVLLRVFNNPLLERNQLHFLAEWLTEQGLTTVLTSRILEEAASAITNQYLEYVSDCLIRMDMRVVGQIATRRLRVVKYRGSSFGSNEYPCVITGNGIRLLPISKMNLVQAELGSIMSSGCDDLDHVLGGGYRRGSSVMIAGSSGIGKTTILCTFVQAACARGEKILYISFEESEQSITGSMRSVGIDLQPFLGDGPLKILTGLPESMGAEEHLIRILECIEDHCPDHVIVDAISATMRIGVRQAAFEFLMRLISLCKEQAMTCLVSNQNSVGTPLEQYGALDISTLVDAILLLRYIDDKEEIKRIARVLKSRGMAHSSKYQEYRITDTGIEIIGPKAPPPRENGLSECRSSLWQAEDEV